MSNAAQLYAVALAITLLAAYILGIRKKTGKLSVRSYLEFPGLLRHFFGEIQREGMRRVLSPDMLATLLFFLLLIWIFLVGPLWTLLYPR